MTTWIKICGLTTPDAVAAALDSGADAIGFVFAKSVRQVTPDVARRLAAPARGRAGCVAVTRHPTQQDIDDIVAIFKPDALQTDVADLLELRLPAQLQLLPVFRGAAEPEAGRPRSRRRKQHAAEPPVIRGRHQRRRSPVRLDRGKPRGAAHGVSASRRPEPRQCCSGHRSGAAVRRRRIELE